ncbi:hypothetical protein BEWA_024040 [Theileria equi strain WA]|uniref:Uncharacterized protein n=1 Tax=Theileria equi strain WA TaxID=1537102 RepID=L0AVI0_THEEQ|nr:hypothetical protein BEWA_024040 [Theileria equi strain WA]AFZ79555.1 hypothetical protein BEWA_024040 [Theileria equi strain WA]|eukprot:XP_004829221.1 hypothetical protein BEWA_024040 [Theileria equi strain WA]
MECIACGTIIEHKSAQCIKLYDGIGIGSTPNTDGEVLRKIGRFMKQFEPLAAVWEFVHTYYLANAPTSLNIYNAERAIVTSIRRFLGSFQSFANMCSLASSVDVETGRTLPSTRSMVFNYCYFGNSLAIHSGANGVLVFTGLDKGNLDLSDEKVECKGSLQVSRVVHDGSSRGFADGTRLRDIKGDSGMILPTSTITTSSVNTGVVSLANTLGEREPFITSVSTSPMCSFGTLLLVTFSDGTLELWKESVSLSNFTDRIWSSIGASKTSGYPYYSLFSPSGELALVITTEGTKLLTCPGLEALNIADGSSSHLWSGSLWSTPNYKIVAVAWINNHEFLSLTEHRHLMLTRKSDPGFWNRVAHFDLQGIDVSLDKAGIGSTRLQIDGAGRVYLLMQNSLQVVRLTWHDHETPECIVLKLESKDLLIHEYESMHKASLEEEKDVPANLSVYDLTIDAVNDLMAIIVSERRMVCIYNLQSMRLLHVLKPPKSQLKAMGIKFLQKGGILAVRWVAISLEVMEGMLDEEYKEFEIEHSAILGDLPYPRCTLVYKVSGTAKRVMEDCFADIIAGQAGRFNENITGDVFEGANRPIVNSRPFRENIYSVDEFIQRKRSGLYT